MRSWLDLQATIADFSVAGMMTYFQAADFPFPNFPMIRALVCADRVAFESWARNAVAALAADANRYRPCSIVTGLQLGDNLRQRQALCLEQQCRVIQKIRRLANDRLVALRDRRQGQLDAFFADLLRDAGQTLLDQFCGVAAGGGSAMRCAMICSSLPRNSRR